jgi:hypothetical protein
MIARPALAALTVLTLTAPRSSSFSYSQDFNGMGTETTAPPGWAVFALPGSHDRFKPLDDTVGTGALPDGVDVAGGAQNDVLLPAMPDTSTRQKGRAGFNWSVNGSSTERSLGTSPSGVAAMVLELTLSNTGAPTNRLSIVYDVRVLSTTVPGNKGYATSGYDGIEELPGYRLYYSLDQGKSFTNVASLNADPRAWPNALTTIHLTAPGVALSGTWQPKATLILRWVDDNAQSPSPDQKLGLDNLTIATIP